ncbi:hypothetical protein DEO72_LG2g5638 [Vigna unguiculata]|uniref:Uncharacterized protein n=1 Tax=Vigna unguiculata TaxID=3917 RepID=A0A4D6L9P7_VIGUN|nr:hypothetical protein DEO72_LG2g5638 [Vigna unguiculata]
MAGHSATTKDFATAVAAKDCAVAMRRRELLQPASASTIIYGEWCATRVTSQDTNFLHFFIKAFIDASPLAKDDMLEIRKDCSSYLLKQLQEA